MGLNANEQTGGGFTFIPIEPDTYPSRLVGVVEMGLQAQFSKKFGEKDPINQLGLIYEIPDVFRKDQDGNDMEDRPVWIKEVVSFYNLKADRATSTKRYNVIDPTHEYGGDWTKLLSSPVALTVVINEDKSTGRMYENVDEVSRPMRGTVVPELVNDPFFFTLDNPEKEAWDKIPAWMQDKIKKNLNFKGSTLEAVLPQWEDGETDTGSSFPSEASGIDDVPF